MPKKEKGEFEFVLENSQIIITLAVLTSLFGVIFAVGYVAGRKSVPTAPLVASESPPADSAGSSPAPPPRPASAGSDNTQPAQDDPTPPRPSSAPNRPERVPMSSQRPQPKLLVARSQLEMKMSQSPKPTRHCEPVQLCR